MNPGTLNQRAIFQRDEGVNGAQGRKEDWQPVFTAWVGLRPLNPQRRDFLGQSATQIPTWILMRKDPGKEPLTRMRALICWQRYNILAVREYPADNKYWELEAMEVLP